MDTLDSMIVAPEKKINYPISKEMRERILNLVVTKPEEVHIESRIGQWY